MNVKRFLPLTAGLIFSTVLAACGGAFTPSSSTSPTAAPAAEGAATTAPAADAAATTAPAAEGAATAAPAAPAADGEKVELRFAWWGSQTRHDRTLQVIELFQQEHPNITIVPEYGSWDDHWTKLATQAAGGNLPDIVQQDYSRLDEWVSRDLLTPLDPFVADGTLNLDDVNDEQISGGKVNDTLYAVNIGTNAMTVVYDPALFEEAGVAVPESWTWSEFQAAATTIHDKLGITGIEGIYGQEIMKMWLKDQGAWFYSDDGQSLGYDDDAMAQAYFEKLVEMQDSGAMASREFEASRGTIGVEDSQIVTQKASMIWLWSNQAAALDSAAKDRNLGLLPLPYVDGAESGIYLKPGQFLSVSSQSKHPVEAAMFIDFFTNSIEANQILAAERGVPISSKVREALSPELSPIQQKIFAYISKIEPIAKPINNPDPATHAKILSDVYNPLIDQLLYGEITPEQAATQLREEATPVLSGE